MQFILVVFLLGQVLLHREDRPNDPFLLFVELLIFHLQVSEVVNSVDVEIVIVIINGRLHLADLIIDIELLRNPNDVLVKVLVKVVSEHLLAASDFAESIHHLEEIQLRDLVVVVGIKHVESNLLKKTPVLEQLLQLGLEFREVNWEREGEDDAHLLG
jgi:hypothetical protein